MFVIANKFTGEIVRHIVSNHSMSLDEAINLVGEFVDMENIDDPNVVIDEKMYWYDDLDLVRLESLVGLQCELQDGNWEVDEVTVDDIAVIKNMSDESIKNSVPIAEILPYYFGITR